MLLFGGLENGAAFLIDRFDCDIQRWAGACRRICHQINRQAYRRIRVENLILDVYDA